MGSGISTRRSGFTLVELLLATTLLVLAASVVVFNVEGFLPTYRIEGAARRVGATAAEVQSEAAVSGKVHGIVYDLAAGEYWILAPPGEEDPEYAEEPRDEDDKGPVLVALQPFQLHTGVEFADVSFGAKGKRTTGRVTLLFEPDGTGTPHAVHLRDRSGKEYTVEVNPFAGTVDFFEGYREFDLFIDEEN